MKIKIVSKWLLVSLMLCAETVIQPAAAPHWTGNRRVRKNYEDERKEREFFKVIQTGDLGAIQKAIAWGVDVNAIDLKDGETALMKAVSLDCVGVKCDGVKIDGVKILEALLDARADSEIESQGAERWTVLEKAIYKCKTTMVRALLDRKVNIDSAALQLVCARYGDSGESMPSVIRMLINAYRVQLIRQCPVVKEINLKKAKTLIEQLPSEHWQKIVEFLSRQEILRLRLVSTTCRLYLQPHIKEIITQKYIREKLIKFIEPALVLMMERGEAPFLYESDRNGLSAVSIALLRREILHIEDESKGSKKC